jgi:hypothetical protein
MQQVGIVFIYISRRSSLFLSSSCRDNPFFYLLNFFFLLRAMLPANLAEPLHAPRSTLSFSAPSPTGRRTVRVLRVCNMLATQEFTVLPLQGRELHPVSSIWV